MRCFCSKDCPDTCSFDISLSPGGGPVFTPHQRPYTPRPFLCSKLRGFYDVEASDSPGSFYMEAGRKVEAESDAAIDKAAELIRRDPDGRILYLRGSGSLSWRMSAWDALFARLDKVWFVDGNPCDETGIVAHKKDFSVCINPPVERLEQADTILLFGKNAKAISPHLYVYLKTLSEKGTRIVLIDPVQTGTSRIAERYIRIAPAGDGLLAAAILSRLNLETGLDWLGLKHTAGVLSEDFEYLCSLFTQREKIAIITGFSLQRYSNGMNIVRWINRLAVLTGNEELLFYGKSSKEGLESTGIKPSNLLPIADLPKSLLQNFFGLIVVVGANPCVTYPESAVWMKALEGTPLISVDVRDTETTAHADVFLRVCGMFGQEDAQESYFFNDGVRVRPEGFLAHHPSDADTAGRLAQKLGIQLKIKGAAEIGTKAGPLPRHYACKGLKIVPPLSRPGYRLLTVSHPLFLNSQMRPEWLNKDACLFVSEEVAAAQNLMDGQLLRVKNHIGFFEAPCRITPTLQGPVVLTYKNRPMHRNWPNYTVESRATDSGNGLNYYDTFVMLEKI